MESIVEQVLNAENIRIMVLLVFGCCCYVLLKTSFEKRLDGLDKEYLPRLCGTTLWEIYNPNRHNIRLLQNIKTF